MQHTAIALYDAFLKSQCIVVGKLFIIQNEYDQSTGKEREAMEKQYGKKQLLNRVLLEGLRFDFIFIALMSVKMIILYITDKPVFIS